MSVAQTLAHQEVGRVRSTIALRAPAGMDYLLLCTILGLVGFSFVMVYSTTGLTAEERMGDSLYFIKRQLLGGAAGIALMFLAAQVPVHVVRKLAPIVFMVAVFALLLTLIPGIGDTAGGATRWVRLGPIRFQPAEFVKVSLIVYMATYFARHERRIPEFIAGLVKPLGIVAAVAFLLLLQPDFGSSAVVILVVLGMAAVSGARLRYLAICGLVVAACMAALVVLSPYRMQRVISFLSPFADPAGKGYQLVQSLIAVGTGQLTGVGLGSSQQKLFFLPAAHTDFIFAVIAEELGFVGAITVMVAFLVILWRGLAIANHVIDDTFSYALAVGLTLLIVAPALLNIGVVMGMLPTKGMVLPLVGYGSSSLVASLTACGLLLGIDRQTGEQKITRR